MPIGKGGKLSEIKTGFIGVKIEPSIAEKAKDAAWRKRQTLSEFVRVAIVQELKRQTSGAQPKEKRGETM